ncbi:MAG: acyl carrier protein [Ruminococcaceae bacterium]|nr:acyl carrier protein [Oscillospiraceae bacterium]
MFETVKALLSKQLRIPADEITLDSKIKDDLGADSIAILQLLMTIEEDYGIVIPDEKLATFDTVADVVAYLDSQK